MAEARKVVGWFYRSGRRIPIFEKNGISSGKPGKQSTARTSARVERDYVNAAMEGVSRAGGPVPEEAVKYTVEKNIDLTNANNQIIRDRVKALDRKSRNEVLEYSDKDAKAFDGVFDVASPRETANLMGKRVRTSDGKIVRPVKRSGIDMETRVNDSIGRNPEAYGITPESKVNDAVAESVGRELGKKPLATGKGSLRTKPAQDQARLDRVGKGLTKAGAKLTAADMEYYVNQKRSNKAANNSEMRRRMWGAPGIPGEKKPTLDIRGKKRSSYDIPQRRAFADKPIEESYIKYVMKEYGFSRADAIKLIKDKREGK